MDFELRRPGNKLIGSFASRPVALTIAREVLGAGKDPPTTLLLQELDGDRRIVGEEILAAREGFPAVRFHRRRARGRLRR